MTTDDARWQRLNDLLAQALEQPTEQRRAWVAEACEGDAALEAELLELLEYDLSETGDLRASIASASVRATDAIVGTAIGNYRITNRIAEGGMGVVYAGTREGADFEQRVAVKIMHSHQLDDVATARFIAERRILATLSHPNIASLIDGGMTEDGLPFIVMEYVEGENIADYCARRKLDNASIIRLVIDLCGAIQYAHNQLVIHRDIKPSNILVDSNGAPRLLDFGIAKLLERDGSDGQQTRPEWRAVTPLYASPEQLGSQPVSTAADVYGVGLLLYRLLTGRLPYTPTSDHPRDVESAILSSPAEPPSSAVTRADGAVSEQWAQKQRRALRGDLDTILLKALRKEPERRYATVNALAEDLGRYLEQLPIRARRDTLAYRARKFVARNRLPVALSSLLVASAVGLTVFYTARLETERAVAQQTADFFTDLFVDTNPYRRSREKLTVAELVDVGAEKVAEDTTLAPLVRARLQGTIAVVLNYVSEPDRAEVLITDALSTYESNGDREGQVTALRTLSDTRLKQGRYVEGLELLDEAIRIAGAAFGERSLRVGSLFCAASYLHYRNGDYDATFEFATMSLEIYEAELDPDDPEMTCPLDRLGTYYQMKGEPLKALELERRMLDVKIREVGPDDQGLAAIYQSIGISLTDIGDYRGAIESYKRATDLWGRFAEGKATNLPLALYGLAHTTGKLGDFAESHRLFEELVALQVSRSGETHDVVAYWLNGHGDMLANIGATALADAALQRAMNIYDSIDKPAGHFDRSVTLVGLGKVARDRGELGTAERLMQEGLTIRENTIGVKNAFTQLNRIDLADVWYRQGRNADARDAFNQALEVLEANGHGDHPTAAQALTGLARIALAEGRYDEAMRLLERSIEMTEPSIGRDHLDNVDRQLLLADALDQSGDSQRAGDLRTAARAKRDDIMRRWRASLTRAGGDP